LRKPSQKPGPRRRAAAPVVDRVHALGAAVSSAEPSSIQPVIPPSISFTGETLRHHFRRRVGISPAAYATRFRHRQGAVR
jgi:methylphosphotriester-DNA--protein-cysteine methyltransferase